MGEHIIYEVQCGALAFGGINDADATTCMCHIHNEREPIVRVQRSEWLSNCINCNWRRWYGNDQALARDESRRHWLRHQDHKTTVQKRNRPAAIDAEWHLKRKIADLGGMWYNGRVQLPGNLVKAVESDEPPF
jgi:hypothetical protein